MTWRRTRWAAAGLLLSLGLAWLWPHCSGLFDPQTLVNDLNRLGPWREVVFVAIHVVAAAFALPGAVVAIAGGAVFGTLWGTIWSVLGATLGASIAFGLARIWGQPWCHDRLRPDRPWPQWPRHQWPRHQRPLAWLNQQLQARAFWCVLTLRLTPISPFSLMNLLLGLTSVRFIPYLGGTLLGIVPGTLAYSWIGAAGLTALSHGALLPLAGALGFLALLSALPLVLGRPRPDCSQ